MTIENIWLAEGVQLSSLPLLMSACLAYLSSDAWRFVGCYGKVWRMLFLSFALTDLTVHVIWGDW